jgi:hypothetical protein
MSMPIRQGLHVSKPRFDLASRPFPPQHNRAAFVVSHEVERVLADNADHGNCAIEFLAGPSQ